MVLGTLDLRINNVGSTIKKQQQRLNKNRYKWRAGNYGKRQELIEDLKERLEDRKINY